MARKLQKHKLIKLNDINEKIKLIDDSDTDYISENGNVYKDYGDNLFFPKKTYLNNHNGYVYCGITYSDGKNRQTRVHRLIAKAFLENPNGYDIVGHKNNIKHDNRLDNLYWTTVQENTQKAYNDGLANNAKGICDSQSQPILAYKNGVLYKEYGSITECSRKLNVPISTIIRRCKKEIKTSYRNYKEFDFEYK